MALFTRWGLAGTLLLVAFSGCIGGDSPPKANDPLAPVTSNPYVDTKAGRDLRLELKETDTLTGPGWKVGDWFGHHVFFGVSDATGSHIETVVYEESSAAWMMASLDQDWAKIEAAFDIPIMGSMAKDDLSTTFFEQTWDLYEFPLSHQQTWTRDTLTFDQNFEAVMVSTTYTVTYNAEIATPDGERPGFDIVGVDANGAKVLAYDFVPDIGWYAHWYMYNLATEDPEDFVFHVMSMGHGSDKKGTYYVSTGDLVLEHLNMVGVIPSTPPEAVTDANPTATFPVAEDATYVFGFLFAFAFVGIHEVLLIDPTGAYHKYEVQATSTDEPSEIAEEIDLPAVAGEWRIVTAGAGAFVGGGAFLFSITETVGTLA